MALSPAEAARSAEAARRTAAVQVAPGLDLRVWAPGADYMLAMKCRSARFDTHDGEDVRFLIRHLGLREPAQVFEIIARYYPDQAVPARTRFFVEEILSG